MEISDQIVQALGWTMLHSFWQGLIIFLIIRILFFIGEEYISAQSKSLLLTLGITSLVIWGIATFINYSFEASDSLLSTVSGQIGNEGLILFSEGTATEPSFGWGTIQGYLNAATFYLPYLWMLGVFYYLSKTVTGLFWIRKIKKQSVDPATELSELGEKVRRRLNLKKLEIRISESVTSPVVIGVLKSTVLFPISWSMGLSNQQLEYIIAHEAGHILRRDGILNLYISFIESLLFFNPFFWLLKISLNTEMEKACDSIAVQYSGNRKEYAQTLLSVAQHNLTNNLSLSSPFFKLNRNEFLHRIKYIMEGRMEKQTQEKQGSVLLAMVLMIGMILFQINDLTESKSNGITSSENTVEANIISNGNNHIESTPELTSISTSIEVNPENDKVRKIKVVPNYESYPKVEPEKIKIKTVSSIGKEKILNSQVMIKLDTVPDPEKWEKFAEDMRKMEEEMAKVLEGQEEKLEEMNAILEEFNEEWADQMRDLHEDMEISVDMDFGDLAEIGEHFADIQMDLSDIKVEIDTDMMMRLKEEMKVHEEYMYEMRERIVEEEMRWKEEEEKWREEESKWKEEERRYRDFENDLRKQLVKDGFIDSEEDPLTFKYDDNEINVNGQSLNDKQERIYRELLKKHGMKGKGSIMWN